MFSGSTKYNRPIVNYLLFVILGSALVLPAGDSLSAEWSDDTQECLGCHEEVTPGIVADWLSSLHSQITPSSATQKTKLEQRISVNAVSNELKDVIVGCAECHTLEAKQHGDTFEHNGFDVHTIVTPEDCATCHPEERSQYAKNLMSNAYGNLTGNAVFSALVHSVNPMQSFDGDALHYLDQNTATDNDSCLSCHGTKVLVREIAKRDTEMGEMEFPVFEGWPNVGVGRINPDGSKGACTSCHPRHSFSIKIARGPYTCAQCHKGPDVPAYPVYKVSKHGNIYDSLGDSWNFTSVPWKVGEDFTAPTCATCHVSLLVSAGGDVIAKRTHRMNDRASDRLFGLIYSTPAPKSPDTTIIRNEGGLPLPSELTGAPASKFLISSEEQNARRGAMVEVCAACHSQSWYGGHFEKLDLAIEQTNHMTLEATKILLKAWDEGLAKGLPQEESPFDEAIEKQWVEQWLFYGNSIRFATAMGGTDYGVFANGRWFMSRNLQSMAEWLSIKKKAIVK